MKKLRLLRLLIPLLMSSLNLLAYNDGDKFTVGNFRYTVTDAENWEVDITRFTGKGTASIPSTVTPSAGQTFTVTSVGDNYDAYEYGWGSSDVTAVSLPSTIRLISHYAFRGTSITSLTIPASVDSIGGSFQSYTTSTLKTISVNTNNPYFQSSGGVVYTKGLKRLVTIPKSYSGLSATNTTFSVPAGVDSIAGGIAYGVANLVTLSIPASVSYIPANIGNNANLTTINVNASNANYMSSGGVVFSKDGKTLISFPSGKTGSYTVPAAVKEIVSRAFTATRISSINLNQVEGIQNSAFIGTASITSITIPASVKRMDPAALTYMNNLASITVNANNAYFKMQNNALYDITGDTLKRYPPARAGASYSILADTRVIEDRAFYYADDYLTSVTIPVTVTEIGNAAFAYCTKLTTVTFTPTSQLKSVGPSAFSRCSALERINFPASLEKIGAAAFSYCTALKTVTVAGNSQLKSIGSSCFAADANLTTFSFSGDISRCRLDSIGTGAFRDTKLASFSFPPTIRHIGESAFNGCTALNSVTFSDYSASAKLDTICGGAFANTPYTFTQLPASVKCIGREAFWNCKTAATLSISEKTDSISPEAFKGCYTLQHLNVAKANPKYSSVDGMLLSKDKETLILFPPGKANDEFTLLAPSIRTIGDYAFYQNERLTNVVIPNRVTSLGRRAFGLCPNLNTLTLLCDNFLDPANIKQLLNEATFDDGNTTETDYRANIDLHVRKELLTRYEAEPFYDNYFKSINPSFSPMRNPSSAADGTNELEEYIAVSENDVSLIKANSDDKTYVVPTTVYKNRRTPYTVGMIGDYAFHGCSAGIEEVVVPGAVSYLGAKSFLSDTTNVDASSVRRCSRKTVSASSITNTKSLPTPPGSPRSPSVTTNSSLL